MTSAYTSTAYLGPIQLYTKYGTYNRIFLETEENYMKQTYRNWEAIVVNDGSPDNTEEVVRQYMQQDNRISYLPQQNQGVSAARNNGIKQAKGEFILPLDADDWIKPTYIEKAVRVFSEHPETTLVYCLQCSNNFGWDSP